MDDNKVAILLEDLLSKFRTFGQGQEDLRNSMERLEQKVDGLTEDMDIVKPSLMRINNRLNNIKGEIISLTLSHGQFKTS